VTEAHSAAALELEHVSMSYPMRATSIWHRPPRLEAVRDVSVQLGRGETLGLVGESGCGKSTLGRIALTVLRPTAGTVRVEGTDASSTRGAARRRLRRGVQAIFQDTGAALNPRFTIGQSIAEPLAAGGVSRAERRVRVGELMQLVGLDPARADAYPRQLSGGQRQRVLIARAFAPQPAVIVADEPVSALDVSVQAQILNLFRDLQQRERTSTLFISHDLAVVGFVADRVAVMYLGEIVEIGPALDVLQRPAHPYTALLKTASSGTAGGTSLDTQAADRDTAADPAARPDISASAGLASTSHTGCPFQPRCPLAYARCAVEAPTLRALGDGRQVACHLDTI
jgi:oligopeptide/dipeptide ABC transporter ATP-binding protein